MVKRLPTVRETWVQSLGQEDPLEKEMATHSVLLPGKSHGLKSVVGYSPWGRKEGFPGGSEVKASACNTGDLSSIPGLGRFPWRRKWRPTPVLLPGESHGWRNLMGYSPRGRKESDMTE